MKKKKIIFGSSLIVLSVAFFLCIPYIVPKILSYSFQKDSVKLSNIEIDTKGWIFFSKKPPVINMTRNGINIRLSEHKKMSLDKFIHFMNAKNIPFQIEQFSIDGRKVEALKTFESYSTAKDKIKYQSYKMVIPPNIFLIVDIDDDKQLKEKEAYLRNFLATNVKMKNKN